MVRSLVNIEKPLLAFTSSPYPKTYEKVDMQKYPQLYNSFEFGPYSIAAQSCCVDIRTFVLILALRIQVDSQGHRK